MRKVILFSVALLFSFSIYPQNSNKTTRPIVSNISVEAVSSARILVKWELPEKSDEEDFKIKSLLVYRSTQPFGGIGQINSTDPIASLSPTSTEYTDILKNFREYYYAVLAETKNGKYEIVLPSINATVTGIRAKPQEQPRDTNAETPSQKTEKFYISGQKRELPLPYLELLGETPKTPGNFSDKAKNAAKALSSSKSFSASDMENVPLLDPYYFDEDLIVPDGGDDYFLFEALKKTFARKKYSESLQEFEKLLNINRSASVTNRTIFYRGQAFYFTGNYEKAITTFLQVDNAFPQLTKKWIEASLKQLKIEY